MASETVQGDGPIIIHAVSISGGPADHLSSIVGPGILVIGGTMRLAGTKYICHLDIVKVPSAVGSNPAPFRRIDNIPGTANKVQDIDALVTRQTTRINRNARVYREGSSMIDSLASVTVGSTGNQKRGLRGFIKCSGLS